MALEDQLWRIAEREVKANRACVLCSVVWGTGSVPREIGARMLLGETGLLAGTVGGGCGESEVLVHARKVIAGFHAGGVVDVDLSGDFEQDQIQVCGGRMRVSVERLGASDTEMLRVLAEAERGGAGAVLVSRLARDYTDAGQRYVAKLNRDGLLDETEAELSGAVPSELMEAALVAPSAMRQEHDGEEWLAAVIGRLEELVIVGSGHVAQPLAQMAAMLSYRVSVIDDRPSYVTPDRFPDASRLMVGKHDDELRKLAPGDRASVVIITRGHQHDEASLRAAVEFPCRYIGMIGSRRRAIETVKRLRGQGADAERLARVHTPIGLDIGAQTPEEIALAILAEMVRVRRGGGGGSLSER